MNTAMKFKATQFADVGEAMYKAFWARSMPFDQSELDTLCLFLCHTRHHLQGRIDYLEKSLQVAGRYLDYDKIPPEDQHYIRRRY